MSLSCNHASGHNNDTLGGNTPTLRRLSKATASSPRCFHYPLLHSSPWLGFLSTSFTDNSHSFVNMADRQVTQQTIFALLAKLDDPDADLRYMSLNDLYGILTNPNSLFLSHDRGTATKLAGGLLKALDDQHGDVQNQALKWYSSSIALRSCWYLTRTQSRSSRSSLTTRIPYTSSRAVGQFDCLPDDRHIGPQHCSSRHRRYAPSSPVGPASISKFDYCIHSSFGGLGSPFDWTDSLNHRTAELSGERHDGEGSITGLQ